MSDLEKSEEHERELYANWVDAEGRCKLLSTELKAWQWNTFVFTVAGVVLGCLLGLSL